MSHRRPKQYLRTARLAACLSQAELGALLGASATIISNIECDRSEPTAAFVLGAVLLFGKPSERLFPYLFNSVQEALGQSAAVLDQRLEGKSDTKSLSKIALISAMAKCTITFNI
jgi:transcriptional regulator with XRE-family HTH domain